MIAGSDDMYIRVFNYNTMKKVKVFEAHSDYIRCLAVHPTQPFVLSTSDDMSIKVPKVSTCKFEHFLFTSFGIGKRIGTTL